MEASHKLWKSPAPSDASQVGPPPGPEGDGPRRGLSRKEFARSGEASGATFSAFFVGWP